jgi:hypothetical protein
MNPIIKLYLKIFLFFVFCYGVINLVYYFFDTSYFDFKNLYQIFIFGCIMSLTLVTVHLVCLKRMKINKFTNSNLAVVQSKVIISNLNKIELFQKIENHPLIRKLNYKKIENVILIHTGLNWKTWGEVIKIECVSQNDIETVCKITSKPKLITTILDYGKSLENLNMIENIIKN